MIFLERQFEELGYKVDSKKNKYSLRKYGTNEKKILSGKQLDNELKKIRNKLVIDEIINKGGF
jgi:hypothetical protein